MDVHDRIREYWNRDAATYDSSVSHAVSDPVEAAAWRAALARALPPPPVRVLDVGAGTGSLSLLAAELGYDVMAFDVSEGMLARARAKAEARGVDLTFEAGSAMSPPAGPFDVVMERHVLWTIPDPLAALQSWRRSTTPGGRLVLFEGIWGSTGALDRARRVLTRAVRTVMRVPDDHHAPYPQEVLDALPLAAMPSPAPFVELLYRAGWTAVRIQRLRDVEWAALVREPWPLGPLEHRPRYALVATAGEKAAASAAGGGS